MQNFVSRFVKDESGATAIEYGLIAALIAVGIIGAARVLGTTISATFTQRLDRDDEVTRTVPFGADWNFGVVCCSPTTPVLCGGSWTSTGGQP